MGTHPIFESDFDCLTESKHDQVTTSRSRHWRRRPDLVLIAGSDRQGRRVRRRSTHRPGHARSLFCRGGSWWRRHGAPGLCSPLGQLVDGHVLNTVAKKSVKVLVVGNPANTNALIASQCAPSIPKENFSALTRLDQNRATSQIAMKCNVPANQVEQVTIWGNHSATQYPDAWSAKVAGESAQAKVNDDDWLKNGFITTVQKRGAAVLEARKFSSAMSAAKAIADYLRDWINGTSGRWVSMAVNSTGNPYGIPEGLIYSFPVTCEGGKWTMVSGVAVSDFSREKLVATADELAEERKMAFEFLNIA